MINTEDAISGEYTRDKTICQHSAFQDRVLTVGNIEPLRRLLSEPWQYG